MSEITDLMRQAFDKVLPIPKTPKIYRPPPPPKPLSWVPSGSIGNTLYEERLSEFAREIKAIDAQRTKRIKYSTRGWCYLLEGLSKIHKGEFSKTQKAINDCRKLGLLPIDFVAEDQDITRRFAGIHEASDPVVSLTKLKEDMESMLNNLPAHATDYWTDEEYYVMMCVEKGDIRNLFKPICDEYHVPIVNSKGWPPILLRNHIAKLSMKAEGKELTPVLLLFYDHDPAGMKIADKFEKMLWDVAKGTGWMPFNLVVDRFGLSKEDIEKYDLTWIENLRTSSGRQSRDWGYIEKFGRRKCESNALFKNDDTLIAGEVICRNAIEKYYGEDALERFKEKEEASKEELSDIYDNPIWEDFTENLDELIKDLATDEEVEEEELDLEKKEKVVYIFQETDRGSYYYGKCPECGTWFDYDKTWIGRLVRCRWCSFPMRLRKAEEGSP